MATKRKATLKQVFNAWLKYNKKSNEAYKSKRYVEQLAVQCEAYTTELIEHEGNVYRVTINKNRLDNNYEIKKIAEISELPVSSSEKS
jgi:hypothetical protein